HRDPARGHEEGNAVRRRGVRPGEARGVREGLPRPHDGRVVTRPGLSRFVLPLLGLGFVLVVWTALSQTIATDLPSPARTWQESRRYVLEPFFKDGEMNQGIGRLAFYSLVRVGKGYLVALLIGTPIGFMLGLSRRFHETFDSIIQFLRPISTLAWLPLAGVQQPRLLAHHPQRHHDRRHRLPPRPADGRGRGARESDLMPYLEVRDVHKTFATPRGATHVLGGASLALDDGEFVAIVG